MLEIYEWDLIWMSALVFLPTVAALGLLFFPRKAEQAMLWYTLGATALTLGISIAIFINYKMRVIDATTAIINPGGDSRIQASLDHRSRVLDTTAAGASAGSDDWVTRRDWIPRFSIYYYMGLDGISMALILLTTVITFLAMIASFHIKCYEGSQRFVRGYCMLFLVLETGMLGTFLALDFFLFYVFWEVMLLPMYFLIGVWGGSDRLYAAIKFFLYTLLGSVFILIALLGFYFTNARDFVTKPILEKVANQWVNDHPSPSQTSQTQRENAVKDAIDKAPVHTFDLIVLARAGKAALQYLHSRDVTKVTSSPQLEDARATVRRLQEEKGKASELNQARTQVKHLEDGLKQRLESEWFFTPAFQYTMFILLFIGFAIKIPVVPFHTWLPDAHVQAPTPISMILAGVLLKMGGYGLLRIAYPICPYAAEQLAFWVALLGIISIVYGAFAAMAQEDFKKLVAYSSVSHMGYVTLGIAVWGGADLWSWGMNGALFQMIAHGITSAGMFFCVGVIYDRAHHRIINNFKGLYEPMPFYTGLSAIVFFAAMGLPGMCGFVGEFMVVLSTWKFAPGGNQTIGIIFSILAAFTVVITAAYILWTVQRVYLGTNPTARKYDDITLQELCCVIPLVVLSVLLGVFPGYLLLAWMEPSVTHLVDSLVSVLMSTY
jgi:NADH-quinone oxidoreductase subunit M